MRLNFFNEVQLTAIMAVCRLGILAGDPDQRPWHNQQRIPANLNRAMAVDPDYHTSNKRSAVDKCSAQKWMSLNRNIWTEPGWEIFRFDETICKFLRDAFPGMSKLYSAKQLGSGSVLPILLDNLHAHKDWDCHGGAVRCFDRKPSLLSLTVSLHWR